jgi:asparaginyl-tRNA synthetase
MDRTKIFKLLKSDRPIDQVLIKGWVRTRRDSKGFSFIEVNDGSSLKNIQVVADEKLPNYEDIKKLTTGSALSVSGKLIESKGGGQKWEIVADGDSQIFQRPRLQLPAFADSDRLGL